MLSGTLLYRVTAKLLSTVEIKCEYTCNGKTVLPEITLTSFSYFLVLSILVVLCFTEISHGNLNN